MIDDYEEIVDDTEHAWIGSQRSAFVVRYCAGVYGIRLYDGDTLILDGGHNQGEKIDDAGRAWALRGEIYHLMPPPPDNWKNGNRGH